ncbi:MAG TPA: acyltransferase [Edaphobacter sp.]|nr:acyltransferase [Edaphobacter sp.]
MPPPARPATNPHPSPGRVTQLDAIRGIAAVTVVCHHWWAISQFHPPLWIFRPFFLGREAVILFFVLSGYVLSLPVWSGRQLPYPEYLIRRVFRIYIPFALALALSALGCKIFYGTHLPLTSFYETTWQTSLTAGLFARELLMPPNSVLNGAIWSLRYEMEVSIIFPLLCALLLRTGRYGWLLLCILLRLADWSLVHGYLGGSNLAATNLARFFYFSIFFIIGATLARERIALATLIARIPRPALWTCFLLALALYCNTMFAYASVPTSDFFTMLGAAAVIVLVQDPRLKLGLNSAIPQYLGRISYSMYLVHYTVLFAVFDLAYPKISILNLAILSAIATLIVSHLFCIYLEEPAHTAGKSLARRLRSYSRISPVSA